MAKTYDVKFSINSKEVVLPIWVGFNKMGKDESQKYLAKYRNAPPFGVGETEREAVEKCSNHMEKWFRFETNKLADEAFADNAMLEPKMVYEQAVNRFICRLNHDNQLEVKVKGITLGKDRDVETDS